MATAGLTLAGAPSAAADELASFDLKYGATYFRGTVDFHNRSVTVRGQIRGLSGTGCRHGDAVALANTGLLDAGKTGQVCNGPVAREIKLEADVPGGAGWVQVGLLDADGLGDALVWCAVQRGDEYCERP